jgi:hypothetical protein
MAPLAHFDLAALGGYSDALIFIAFRGPQVQVNQLRQSSSAASQSPVLPPFANTSNGLM